MGRTLVYVELSSRSGGENVSLKNSNHWHESLVGLGFE